MGLQNRIISYCRHHFAGRVIRFAYPALAAAAVFLVYPTITGYQDIASLASGSLENRWLAHLPQAPGATVLTATTMGGVHAAEVDPVTTGAVKGGAVKGGTVALASRANEISTSLKTKRVPQRINRALKGDRVVSTSFVAPPNRFKAGSVLERQSLLAPLEPKAPYDLSFVKPKANSEALRVAKAFYVKKDPREELDPNLPVVVASLVKESASHVLGYNAEPETLHSPFAAVLNEDQPINLIPKLDANDHAWAAQPLPLSAFSEREQNCLTAGIYFESRGEPVRGQAAVAQVILNRVKNPAYPNSICGVVYQNKQWRNRCQFSFACDRIKDRVNDPKRWSMASYVARETTEGRIWLSTVGSATHYHAAYVKPKWASTMRRAGRIGLHIFYRTFGGGWS